MDTPEKIKTAIYVRVSTLLNQDPDNQLIPVRQLAFTRNLDIVKEYIDRGISGSKDRRPALDELIKDARAGKYKILVIYSIDRLARDTRHLLNLINELSHYGVSLISLRESIDLTTAIGQATLTILGAVAQLEAQLIRERIRNALAAKKLIAQQNNTDWRCGRPSVVNEKIEKRTLELRAKGHSIRAIARMLEISKSSVERILRTPLSQKDGENE